MINTKQIIALSIIKDCGPSTIRQIVSKSEQLGSGLLSDSECFDFVNSCIAGGIQRSRMSSLDRGVFYDALFFADKVIEKSEMSGIKVMSYVDPCFPSQLLVRRKDTGIIDAPLLLYYKGDLSVLKQKGIALIGTRKPTVEGVQAGEYLGEKLADLGFNIISGLALGCDSAAHRGALRSLGGKTTAFLAHGLDSVYPRDNEKLALEIVERGGLLMSEYPVGETVNRYRLVERDRLQAALADATIVIQTSLKGGTNHAANTTLASGKPLFCVRYSNESVMNQENVLGNGALVDKGAKFITSSDYRSVIVNSLSHSCNSSETNGAGPALFPDE